MSPSLRIVLVTVCFARIAGHGTALYAQDSVKALFPTSSQRPSQLPSPVPARLPTTGRELVEQLPTGCLNTWDMPTVQAMPFGRFLSQSVPLHDDDLLGEAESDDLLPAPKQKAAPSNEDNLLLDSEPIQAPGGASSEDDLLSPSDALLAPLAGQGEDDALSGMGPSKEPSPSRNSPTPIGNSSKKSAGTDLVLSHPTEALYPSAQTCAKCHPKHYDEWRVSSHAYATISPMFQRFEQAMQELTQGTVGSFCFRCHSPVAVQLCIPSSTSVLDAPPIVSEGITCVACHRVSESIGRTHGDRRIEPGDIHAPVYGSSSGQGVKDARSKANELKLRLSAGEKGPGQPMHQHCGPFEPISKSDFCASCHQVAVHPGIWLEIVHAQYRSGPAHAKGISCQDCHMGSVPGKASGYDMDYCAVISDKPFGEPRKHSNHVFWGPNYSIAHPGIFPHNPKAQKYTSRQWLAFEYRAGWGTKEFEQNVAPGTHFPPPWDNADERVEGRKFIDANLQTLQEKRGIAALTLTAGGRVEGPMMDCTPTTSSPLRFTYRVTNISEGHNMPTGSLGAQPQMWLNVALIDPSGQRIWETGYLDSNGDLADLQSVDVNTHRLPRDAQLFNLQTKFLINNIRGTDREVPAPLNFSLDQLVFLRPGAVPVSVLNHPPLIRMEAHSIPPLDHRIVHYQVPGELLRQPGLYRLSSRLRSRPEPPYFMRLVGASPEMIRRLNENIIDFEISSHTFMIQHPMNIASPQMLLLR